MNLMLRHAKYIGGRGDILKNFFKLAIKSISWLLIVFIILTLIIAITKLSNPNHADVDLESMNPIQREAFMRRYGGNMTVTTLASFKKLSNDVIDYYKMLARGELGYTYTIVRWTDSMGNPKSAREYNDPIGPIVGAGFNRSIKILSAAIGISLILGILKGVYDSKKEKKRNSTFKLFTTVIGLSVPVIFLAPLLQFIIMWLGKNYGLKFPVVGHDTIKHMILPTITLSLLPTMYIARLTAVAMDKAYEDEYVRTAISKGGSKLRVLWFHVFRNAIVEIAGSLPAALTILISDLVLVEYLFSYEGITYMMVDYYDKGQSDVVTGLALVLCGIFLFFYLIFKLMKFTLDPKGRSRAI